MTDDDLEPYDPATPEFSLKPFAQALLALVVLGAFVALAIHLGGPIP